MSVQSQKRTSRRIIVISALPLKADIDRLAGQRSQFLFAAFRLRLDICRYEGTLAQISRRGSLQAEEQIVRMRFGLGMNSNHTLEEVGEQFSPAPNGPDV